MQGIWTKLNFDNNPAPRCSHSATTIEEDIYIIGGAIRHEDPYGESSYFQHYGDIWKMNIIKNELIKLDLIGGDIQPRRGHTAVGYMNRFIIIFGGLIQINDFPISENTELTNELKVFDTVTSRWLNINQGGEIPDPRRGHNAGLRGNKMIIFGGDMHRIIGGRVIWELDLSPLTSINDQPLNSWYLLHWKIVSYQGDMIPIMLGLCATCQVGSKLYLYGGNHIDADALRFISSNRLFCFDLETSTFFDLSKNCFGREIGELPPKGYCAGMSNIDDHTLIVYGGTTEGHNHPSTLLVFHLNVVDFIPTVTWNEVPNSSLVSPGGRNGFTLVINPQPQIQIPKLSSSLSPYFISHSPSFYLSFVFFGGGIFPSTYFNDWYVLSCHLPPGLLLPKLFRDHETLNRGNTFSESTVTKQESNKHLQLHPTLESHPPNILISLVCDGVFEFPAHREIITSRCDYFQSLLSPQWNDASNVKSYEFNTETINLPVVSLHDVNPEMMTIILTEIYQEYHRCVPLPIEIYLSASLSDEGKSMKLVEVIHTLNRFQLDVCQIRWEKYLFEFTASSLGADVLADLTICSLLLALCQEVYTILIPSLLQYYLSFSFKVCRQGSFLEKKQEMYELMGKISQQLEESDLLPMDIRDELLVMAIDVSLHLKNSLLSDFLDQLSG